MHKSMLESAAPVPDRAEIGRVIIVADDLTGACDSGVAFLTSGRSVRVVLDSDRSLISQHRYSEAVLSFTTETRHRTQSEASQRVADVLMPFVNEGGNQVYFKKIDSAARGHFGAEIMAALKKSDAVLALVAPAFPENGRSVLNGILDIRDAAGQHTAVPLRSLFPGVEETCIDTLAIGTEAVLEQRIMQALRNGIQVLLCDGESQLDLERLANAGLRLSQRVLWTGSAGLARALAAALPTSIHQHSPPLDRIKGPAILFVGTDHPVTTLQIAHLEAQPAGPVQRRIHRVDSESPEKIRAAFTESAASALVLTGGDTAAFVLRSLDASSIVLGGEISPGIPWGVLEGGVAEGCMVITKSGGFGERDALVRAFEFCHRRAA